LHNVSSVNILHIFLLAMEIHKILCASVSARKCEAVRL